jgi:hypothetical protein
MTSPSVTDDICDFNEDPIESSAPFIVNGNDNDEHDGITSGSKNNKKNNSNSNSNSKSKTPVRIISKSSIVKRPTAIRSPKVNDNTDAHFPSELPSEQGSRASTLPIIRMGFNHENQSDHHNNNNNNNNNNGDRETDQEPCAFFNLPQGCPRGQRCRYAHILGQMSSQLELKKCPTPGCENLCINKQCKQCHDLHRVPPGSKHVYPGQVRFSKPLNSNRSHRGETPHGHDDHRSSRRQFTSDDVRSSRRYHGSQDNSWRAPSPTSTSTSISTSDVRGHRRTQDPKRSKKHQSRSRSRSYSYSPSHSPSRSRSRSRSRSQSRSRLDKTQNTRKGNESKILYCERRKCDNIRTSKRSNQFLCTPCFEDLVMK